MPKKNVVMESINIYGEDHPIELKGSSTNCSMKFVAGQPDCGDETKDTVRGSPVIRKGKLILNIFSVNFSLF